jgi:hypothetical protein
VFNNQQFQSQVPVNVNRFQPQPAAQTPANQASVPQVPASPQFQSFNLLNQANFQAFDAQFGGAQTSQNSPSNIFAQPQTSLLQGRDVVVNPFSAQQNFFGQQQASANPSAPFTAFRTG